MALFVLRDFDRMNQPMGLELSPADLLAPFFMPDNHQAKRCPGFRRSCRKQPQVQNNNNIVQCNKEQFQVSLDVQHFAPEEITVKVVENSIVVEAKHEEKQDEQGFISRQFVRKCVVPEGYDMEQIASSLSSDGILNITAPKIAASEAKERVIPLIRTGPQKIATESAAQEAEKK